VSVFQMIGLLIALAALVSYLNHRYVRLPSTIGLMAITLLGSLALAALGRAGVLDVGDAAAFVASIDFKAVLLHGMLGFLLFAGALHVDVQALRGASVAVAVLATVGVVAATFIIGGLFWIGVQWLGYQVTPLQALLFGALISPTDPIAVLGIIRQAGADRQLEAEITGESLFNDGIGVVVFLTILGTTTGQAPAGVGSVALFLLQEAAGGALTGLVLGWITYRMLASVDAYKVEVLLTLGAVAGGYALADAIGVSGPIAMVIAGLIVGSRGRAKAMSEITRQNVDTFWELVDEILNAILFMLVGLEVLRLQLDAAHLLVGALAIAVTLTGRLASVGLPIFAMRRLRRTFGFGTVSLLTWGGLRGGLSIAMALSLPPQQARGLILTATYMVVIFSVLVQGLTFGRAIELVEAAARRRARAKPQ
jgi:CPA1 family monovalent cation:H+ antiporter